MIDAYAGMDVEITADAVPTRDAAVYVINGTENDDNGRVTQDPLEKDAHLLVPNWRFCEQKQSGVWLVKPTDVSDSFFGFVDFPEGVRRFPKKDK